MADKQAKRCVICGEDRTGWPRIKDPKGRYYCPDCFEQAKARKHERAAGEPDDAPLSIEPADDANEATCEETAVDEEVQPQLHVDPSLVENLVSDAAVHIKDQALEPCTHCGEPLIVGAVLCTSCGYHRPTGQTLRIQRTKRKTDWAADTGVFITPGVAGGGMMSLFGILFFIGRTVEPAAMAFFVIYAIFALTVSLGAVFFAFSRSLGKGALTLFVPFYVLWFVYGVHDGPYLKWLFGAMLVGAGFAGALVTILGALPGDFWDQVLMQ